MQLRISWTWSAFATAICVLLLILNARQSGYPIGFSIQFSDCQQIHLSVDSAVKRNSLSPGLASREITNPIRKNEICDQASAASDSAPPAIVPLPPFPMLVDKAIESGDSSTVVTLVNFDELDDSTESGEETVDNTEPHNEAESEFWPSSKSLTIELDELGGSSVFNPHLDEIRQLLSVLNQSVHVGDQQANGILARLSKSNFNIKQLVNEIWQHSHSIEDVQLASEFGRFSYRLERRLAVWKKIDRQLQSPLADNNTSTLFNLAGHRTLSFSGIDSQWSDYLLLKDIQSESDSLVPDRSNQQKKARRTLARIYSPALSADQSQYVHQVIDPAIVNYLKSQAVEPVDFRKLLTDLERYETNPSGHNAAALDNHYQNLLWSNESHQEDIASEIHTHYRNANFRLALSEDLMNRMIPQMPATAEPFSDVMLGAKIRGQNNISNQLQVKLIPDPGQLNIRLGTLGQVRSNTIAQRGGFTIRNLGNARFQVFKRLAIGRDGIDSSELPIAYSSANQQLVGLESKFDPIPIVGWIARKVAEKKIRDQAPETERLVKVRVANTASDRMQELVEAELVKMRHYCETNLFQPLMAMDLEPEPLQMTTTENQVIMRYRLAGRDQMAAHTARPRDDGASLLSLQMHQSTINNAIARIELNGNRFTIDELTVHLHDILGTKPPSNKSENESSQDAEFEFAPFDPIHIEFAEDRVLITMNLNSLKLGDGKKWKQVRITSSYIPQRKGMQISLVQDDLGTRITGYRLRFRDRAAIGTVHKVLFKREYEFAALPSEFANKIGGAGLEISQLVVSDGWIAVSINDSGPTKTTPVSSRPLTRIGQLPIFERR